MKEQKIIVCYAMLAEKTIKPLLEQGWRVVSVTATFAHNEPEKQVSGWSSTYTGPRGEVIFLLEG